MGWFDANTTEGDGIMLFQTKSRGGLRTVGNVLTRSTRLIGSGGVFAHNDDDESPDPTPSPIHSLDLTVDLSTSNSFDDYGLATSRTVTDYNGRIVEIPADAVPMGGLRPVRNLLRGVWGASGTPVTLNSSSATDFNATWAAGVNYKSIWDNYFPTTAGRTYCMSANVRVVSGTPVGVSFHHQDSPTGVKTGINPTGTVQRFSAVFLGHASSGTVYMGMSTNGVLPTDLTLDVTDFMVQDITHRADISTAPDEYVSTDDDYGTGVNGFRYFDTELNNSVASNVVTEGTGASIAGWLDYQPGATNLQINSNDFTARTKSASGAGSVFPTVTPGYADGPLGESTATRVQLNRGTSADGYSVILDFNLPVVNATNYTHSIYARTLSGTADIALYNSSNEFDPTNATVHTLTTTWQRIAHAEQSTGAGTAGTGIGLLGSNYCICDQTADILVCAQQFETGTVPTAYIPTSGGSASRPAMSPAPTISGLVGTEDARLTVKGLAADLVTPDPTDTTERTLDVDNTDGEFDTLPSPIKVLSVDVYNDGERPA